MLVFLFGSTWKSISPQPTFVGRRLSCVLNSTKNQRINLRYCIPGYSSFKIETGFFPSSSIQSSRSQCALGLLFSATVLVSLILNPQIVSMAFWEHASFASFFDLPRKIDEIKITYYHKADNCILWHHALIWQFFWNWFGHNIKCAFSAELRLTIAFWQFFF